MSLLLCRQEPVKHPFYVEFLDIHLYSSQELCYVIYNHPLLVLDGFVGEPLLTFLRDELNLGFLALKLERWLKSGENSDEVLTMILQECDYYKPAEINRFKQQVSGIRRMHPSQYRKLKADELFGLRQYGRAVELYQELLELPKDTYVDDMFDGRIWNNLGSCYARMFQLERAFAAFEKAYAKTGEQQVLERLYELTLLDGRLVLGERLGAMVTQEQKDAWEAKMDAARKKAAQSEQVKEIEELFARDPVKRQAGAAKLVAQWKQEYRNMV